MGNDQMNRSLDQTNRSLAQKIKRFESNVEKTIASAFQLHTQLGGTECSNLLAGKMERMAISAYHASGNLLATMFRHNFDCAAKIKPPPAKKAKGKSRFEEFKGIKT